MKSSFKMDFNLLLVNLLLCLLLWYHILYKKKETAMSAKKTFFASNLKYLRLKNNMEQLELANLLGRKSSSSISEWEKGKYTPKSGLLSDIAAIFDVTLTDLMEKDLTLEGKGVTYQLPQRDLVLISEQLSENNYNKWLNFAQDLIQQQTKEDREPDSH